MIGSLSGTIDEIDNNHIILNVNGVGYIIYLSAKSLNFCKINKKLTLFIETYFNTRENTSQFYGFINKEEQKCLRLLVKVNGISYKIAMSILSKLTPEQFFSAVANEDKVLLKISGLGAKLINRIITELHSKVSITDVNNDPIQEDAVSALINLGYEKIKAYESIREIQNESPNLQTQDMIRIALKNLSAI